MPACFNPRSPLPGSEACRSFEGGNGELVSIHAPRCRGAKRPVGEDDGEGLICFNPRSPLPGSEASCCDLHLCHLAVSIHAPRCRGAKRAKKLLETTIERMFQSTLPVAGERSLAGAESIASTTAFQSTLPVAGERSRGWIWINNVTPWFQSTLPVAGERSKPEDDVDPFDAVSIHAPRCRGAKQFCDSDGRDDYEFQSTLPVAGERSFHAGFMIANTTSFNPRSPLPGSEAPQPIRRIAPISGFNPRSPLPGSEA